MLIGIDASRADSPAATGTETYSRELTRALLERDRVNQYRLYGRTRSIAQVFAAFPNVQIRSIPFPRLWTHARLSFEMLTHPPDVLFVPAHVLPLVHPSRSIVTVHDLGHLHFPKAHPTRQRLYHTWATRWNVRAATRVLVDSEATRDDVVHFCEISGDKVRVVYPAYDAGLYNSSPDPDNTKHVSSRFRIDMDYILAIGTIHPRKNYVRLIQAFSKIERSDLKLIIAGKRGWLYDEVFAQVTQLGLDERVVFFDYVPVSDMALLIRGARVLAFPSLHEGFGIPVLEAQACGTPVVCSMTSSLPEAAGDGALFVDPCDVDAIAAAIQRLLEDVKLRSKVIGNGLRNVQRFSWQEGARRVLDIISELD